MSRGPDPRQANGHARRQAARRFAAANEPCRLCHGTLGPIRYDQPRNHRFPLSLAIDERDPVSQWREHGYESKLACATDVGNWQPAHWCCNAAASDKRKPRKLVQDVGSGTF